ncbi:MAG TPA: hemerythrin domain-containing protein [Terriglobales bacterium]|nr:hemerythrin domain-containing protein [Terriglobales bacterium]
MKNIIAVLEHEHREIQKVVTLMSNLAREMERGGTCEAALLDEIVQFMRIFGEQCHHGKEEKALFTLLESKGVPANGCPIAALVGEHRHGHELLNQLEAASVACKAGDVSVRPALINSLKSLVNLYQQHIWKEEYLLFPMANKVLSASDYDTLSQQFEAVESQIGTDVHHAMEAMIDSIREPQPLSKAEDNSPVPQCSVCEC